MKFRIDFVTNSSSTGYVAVSIKTKNGSINMEDDYDTGYGGWIWNYSSEDRIVERFDNVSNGEELFDSLVQSCENFEYWSKDVADKIKGISSRNELISIELSEETNFDEGAPHEFSLKYDFQSNKVTEFVDEECYDIDDSEITGFIRNTFAENSDYSNWLFFDMYEYYMDGHEANIWEKEQIDKWWDAEEKEELIKYFNKNNIHYDPEEEFVSPIKGSSNNKRDLVDIDALIKSVFKDSFSKEGFFDKYADYM